METSARADLTPRNARVQAAGGSVQEVGDKKKLLDARVHPMYHQDVDMFGLVGKDNVVPAVDEFFLKTYADGLRFESVLNGQVSININQYQLILIDMN